MKILFFHWPSTVEPVINQSSWASAEESNIFFCQQKHAHDQRRRAVWATRLCPPPNHRMQVARRIAANIAKLPELVQRNFAKRRD
jgi:hypothetical protein